MLLVGNCNEMDFTLALSGIVTVSNWHIYGWITLHYIHTTYLTHTCPNYSQLLCCLDAANVVLNSSVGMRQACPGEMVTYTCTVTQAIALDWIVDPFISGNDPIRFTSTTDRSIVNCNNFGTVNCTDLNFVATLTNTSNMIMMSSSTLADMTSTLTFTAVVRLNGTVVQCRGQTAVEFPVVNNTLHVIAAGKSCCT